MNLRFAVALGAVLTAAPPAGAQAPPGYGQPQPGYQQPGYQQPGYQQPGYPTGYQQPGYPPQRVQRVREPWEIGQLYGVAAAYGAGMGIWISTESGVEDPGIYAIAPAVLAVAAPAGVFFLDRPKMDAGLPMSVTTGMVIGTGNAVGLVALQHASEKDEDAWGFRELTRSVAIGSTLGAATGYAAGYYLEPPAESGLLVSSGAIWGAAVGAMFGYGPSDSANDFGDSNENAALGGLIGLNVGVLATGALTAGYKPSLDQIGWMWGGAAIGAAVSLPIYLFYVGDDSPPARRGLLFTGTTTTLGIIGGALLGSGGSSSTTARSEGSEIMKLGSIGELSYFAPVQLRGGLGLQLGGALY